MRPGNHTSDESRQGEALQSSAVGERKLYLESYGCQMNFSDSEIVASILAEAGYATTKNEGEADLILLNTCSIRDNAEQRIRHRLQHLKGGKRNNPKLKVGILGCMAERLRDQLLEEEKLVDLVVGPDAYRDLPRLVDEVSAVVVEEMEHFQLVVAELRRRGGDLGLQLPNHYADRLHAASGQGRTSILLDRLLVAHLIEGRSLERFQLLAEHLADRELAALYAGLVASEGRHRALFLSLARERFGDDADARLAHLATAEARILADLPASPTMHGGCGAG